MIAYLEGTSILKEATTILLKVDNGVGYKVHLSAGNLSKVVLSQKLSLYIYSHIREEEFSLYGFFEKQEQEVFECLIRCSGVGPKLALVILDHMGVDSVIQNVQQENTKAFLPVPGIGKKTATRLCLDSKDALSKISLTLENTPLGGASVKHSVRTDVYSALENMGFADKKIRSILEEIEITESFEAQLKIALSKLKESK